MHSLAAVTIYRVFYKFLGLNQSFLNILRDLGCEKVQGYLFSKSVDADTISQLLVSRQHKLGKTA